MGEVFKIPLTLPGGLPDDERALSDFRAVGIEPDKVYHYMTKAAGPPPDFNFWIDLAHHAQAYPVEHLIDQLEGAFGLGILAALNRVRKWVAGKVLMQLLLPTKQRRVQYIIPEEPEASSAVKAIKKHYRSLSGEHANEYFWINGKWISAEAYFKEKRGA
jgi:hypothetical protein